MSPQDFSHDLGDDLWSLVQAAAASVAAVTKLSDISACPAFRLQLEDGRLLKGRRLPTATQAVRTEYILHCVDHPAFPKVLARHQTAILTNWVDGTPLDRMPLTTDLARRCGALQGLLHSIPLPRDNPYTPRTGHRSESGLRQGLEQLARAGRLDPDEAQALLELAVRHAPASGTVGFIHGDFCGENIVLADAGDLYVIDSDAVAVDALDYDLGRTWYRWPMPASLREAFLAGYDSGRSCRDFVTHFPYWAIAATLAGAVFRLRQQPQATAAPVSRLRHLLWQSRSGAVTGEALLRLCDSSGPAAGAQRSG